MGASFRHSARTNQGLPRKEGLSRVARLKYEKIAKFDVKNSQNSHLKLKNSHKLATFYWYFPSVKYENHRH